MRTKKIKIFGCICIFSLFLLSACSAKVSESSLIIERISNTNSSFNKIIEKFKDEEVDVIFINLKDEAKIKALTQELTSEAERIQLLGNNLVLNQLNEGLIGTETIYNELHDDLFYFSEEYKKQTGEAIPNIRDAARVFDAVELLDEGISKVGHDAKTFKEWLSSLEDWEGTSGKLNFDENGDPIDGYKIKIIKNEKVEFYNEEDKPTPPIIPFSSSGLEEYEEKLKPKSEPAKGESIKIEAVSSKDDTGMQKIAKIALSKINSEGGINGRPLELTWKECGEETKNTQIILGICKNTNAQNLFNIFPSESEQGTVLGKFAKEKGFEKIVILTEDQDYTINIEKAFKKAFEK